MRDRRIAAVGLGVLVLVVALVVLLARATIAPAGEGEALILVADFANRRDGQGRDGDPAQIIYEQLIAQRGDRDVRVERLREVVDQDSLDAVIDRYRATLVVWGSYDTLTVVPRVSPAPFVFGSFNAWPAQADHLARSIWGAQHFVAGEYDQTARDFEQALDGVIASVTIVELPNEDAYFQGAGNRILNDSDRSVFTLTDAAGWYPIGFAMYNRAIVYEAGGAIDRAIADYEEVLMRSGDPQLKQLAQERLQTLRK